MSVNELAIVAVGLAMLLPMLLSGLEFRKQYVETKELIEPVACGVEETPLFELVRPYLIHEPIHDAFADLPHKTTQTLSNNYGEFVAVLYGEMMQLTWYRNGKLLQDSYLIFAHLPQYLQQNFIVSDLFQLVFKSWTEDQLWNTFANGVSHATAS